MGDFIFVHDMYGTVGGLNERIIHKIYVREDRTAHTGTAPITGEVDLKTKMDFVTVAGYKRLDIREDADGGRITYYRSEDGIAWVALGPDLDISAHPVTSELYLKAHVDNLAAKVGAPTVYGVDVVAKGSAVDYGNSISGTIEDGDTIGAAIADSDIIEAVVSD